MQVATLPCRAARAGAELTMLALTSGPDGCIGIDVESGAIVRATSPDLWVERPEPYQLITGTMADPAEFVFDAAQPEAVAFDAAPRLGGWLPSRRVERFLRELRHPRHGHLLGWAGPAIAYWTLDGDHPSAALLDLHLPPVALYRTVEPGAAPLARCRFSWAGRTLELPLADRRVAAALHRSALPVLAGPALERAIGGRPRYLLVALSPPRAGHCYKLAAAVLPRP